MAATIDTSKDRFADVWRGVQNSPSASVMSGSAVSWLWEFTDPREQQSFVDFKTAQFGKRFYTYSAAAIFIFLLGGFWIVDLIQFPIKTILASTAISIFTFFVAIPLMLALTAVKQHGICLSPSASYWLENMFMLSFSLSVGSIVFVRIGLGNCTANFLLDFWTCPPVSFLFLTIFIPKLCSQTLPSISSGWMLVCYLWSVLSIGLSLYLAGNIASVPYLAFCYGIMLLLHGISMSTELQLYLYFLSREEMQKQRNEDMRNLIGKIAHDIRTPLVAFSYGLDVMAGSMEQLEAAAPPSAALRSSFARTSISEQSTPFHCKSSDLTVQVDERGAAATSAATAELWSYVQTWAYALEGLQQAHLHLMMIIDRCMDFHKLSHGLPLLPKYAPTSLSLVLEAVINHAHKSLDSAQVKLDRADILGYIMTDPGWLQDNLLCLISNAIRFSSPRSPVLIRIIQTTKQQDRKHAHEDIEQGTVDESVQHLLRIEVEDCGVGLAEDKLPALFNPPEGSIERTQGGAGLGLYCMAERVKALQGEYGVRVKGLRPSTRSCRRGDHPAPAGSHDSEQSASSYGSFGNIETQGSVFWFTIPLLNTVISSPSDHPDSQQLRSNSLDLGDLGVQEVEEHDEDGSSIYFSNPSSRSSGAKASPDAPAGSSRLQRHISKVSFSSLVSRSDESPLLPAQGRQQPAEPKGILRHTAAATKDPTAAQIFKDMHLRVLIVDDSPLILKMLKMMFLGKGHAVATTTNGYEALAMLRPPAEPFDAVLVDIQMPIIDGLQTMREYRKTLPSPSGDQEECKQPGALRFDGTQPLVIAMSANTDHVTMQESYAAGADHFLQKPFDIDTFYAVLLKHHRQHSIRQHTHQE